MVRNSELPEVGAFAQAVAHAVKAEVDAAGISSVRLGVLLGRAQSYAHLRLNGRKAWTLDELDVIARALGTTVDAIMTRARGSS